jgi:hypothetical protein
MVFPESLMGAMVVVFNRCDDCSDRAYPLNVYASRDGCEWELVHENQDPCLSQLRPGHGGGAEPFPPAGGDAPPGRDLAFLIEAGAGEREQLPPRASVHPSRPRPRVRRASSGHCRAGRGAPEPAPPPSQ